MWCKTVTIETKNGPVEINQIDYDEKVHTLQKELSEEDKEKQKLISVLEKEGKEKGFSLKTGLKKLQKAVESLKKD